MPAYKMCRYLGPRVKPGDCGDCDRLCQHDPSYGVVRLSTRCGQPGKCPDYEPKTGLQRLPQVETFPSSKVGSCGRKRSNRLLCLRFQTTWFQVIRRMMADHAGGVPPKRRLCKIGC